MGTTGGTLFRRTRAAALLALIAILFRGIVAPGYMVAPDAETGRFLTVALCGGHGAGPSILDLETGRLVSQDQLPAGPEGDDGTAKTVPCVFAAAASLAEPGPQLALAAPVPHGLGAALPATATSIGRGLAAPPPWPTGPPLRA